MDLYAWPVNYPSLYDFTYTNLIPFRDGPLSTFAVSSGGGEPFPFNYGGENTYTIDKSIYVLSSGGLFPVPCGDFTFTANLCPTNDASGQPPFVNYGIACVMMGGAFVKLGGAIFTSNTNEDPVSGDFDEWYTIQGVTNNDGDNVFNGNALYYHRFSDLTNNGTLESTTGAPIYGGHGFGVSFAASAPDGIKLFSGDNLFATLPNPVPSGTSPYLGNAGGEIASDGGISVGTIDPNLANNTGLSDGAHMLVPNDPNYYAISGGSITTAGTLSDLGLEGAVLTTVAYIGGYYYAAMAYADGSVIKSRLYKSASISAFVEEPVTSPGNSLPIITAGTWYMIALWSESGNIYAVIIDPTDFHTSYGASSIGAKTPNAVYPYHLLVPHPLGCIPLCEDNP